MLTNTGVIGRVHERGAAWGRLAVHSSGYALVVGAASAALALPDAAGGEAAALVRVGLGLLGIAAGFVLWLRPAREVLGWRLAMLWAIAQLPVAAWTEYGSATRQLVEVPLSFSQRLTVNGEVTSYSEFGINLVAIALVAVFERLQRRAVIRQG